MMNYQNSFFKYLAHDIFYIFVLTELTVTFTLDHLKPLLMWIWKMKTHLNVKKYTFWYRYVPLVLAVMNVAFYEQTTNTFHPQSHQTYCDGVHSKAHQNICLQIIPSATLLEKGMEETLEVENNHFILMKSSIHLH